MATALFLLDVIAFVLIVLWAYRNERTGGADSGAGLFGMRSGKTEANGAKRAPRWSTAGAGADKPRTSLPTR